MSLEVKKENMKVLEEKLIGGKITLPQSQDSSFEINYFWLEEFCQRLQRSRMEGK